MAEEQVVEVNEPAALETEAREMGWLPEAEFRGKKDRWVDAKTFVEKGHTVLPIVLEHNKRMQAELGRTNAEAREMRETLKATNAAIKALQESHDADVQAQVKAARQDVLTQLKAAKAAGDTNAEVDLTDQLTQLTAAEREAKRPAETVERSAPALDPVFAAWCAQNPWYGVDVLKTSIADGVAKKLRQDGERTVGAAFMKLVEDGMAKILEPTNPRAGKVEGSTPRGSGSNGKSYDDLPADAKAICDSQAKQFSLVGANRAHKDMASWRKSYASTYFQE